MSTKRLRKLTEKAMSSYEEKVHKFEHNFKTLVQTLLELSKQDVTLSTLHSLDKEFTSEVEDFETLYHEFCKYLQLKHTEESLNLCKLIEEQHEITIQTVTAFRDKLTSLKHQQPELEQSELFSPCRSRSSRSSRHSSATSRLLTEKYAEAKAAIARAEYAEKEATLKKERADLEEKEKILNAAKAKRISEIATELDVLSHKKIAAAAIAEVEAIENMSEGGSGKSVLQQLPKQMFEEKVVNFVSSMNQVKKEDARESIGPSHTDKTSHEIPLATYLLRKDILMNRLTYFDDSSEQYNSWKSTFKQVTSEINAKPAEEIDLLIKWLGRESRKHAQNLKSAYIRDPIAGLQQIWHRLDDRYGSPEAVHKAVTRRLDTFPKLTMHDTTKWYDLADLLMEIAGLKDDSVYSSTLAYFDSSVGMSRVLCKLPQNIQERWAVFVNTYKKRKGVVFPPFLVFVEFISDQAKIRNDPSLQLTVQVQHNRGENMKTPGT
ncbi:uncharacterized protein LOC123557228 [Mercenaria mercenaria]|uniref:uncharacterized protein LOC123557228 n=1 Tax=Mercenaria mercenaria TaxID=6596 RepID=UPI00234EC122|nr:uncharacterized protein LOC123557228 [Mercenaria mercenaria]